MWNTFKQVFEKDQNNQAQIQQTSASIDQLRIELETTKIRIKKTSSRKNIFLILLSFLIFFGILLIVLWIVNKESNEAIGLLIVGCIFVGIGAIFLGLWFYYFIVIKKFKKSFKEIKQKIDVLELENSKYLSNIKINYVNLFPVFLSNHKFSAYSDYDFNVDKISIDKSKENIVTIIHGSKENFQWVLLEKNTLITGVERFEKKQLINYSQKFYTGKHITQYEVSADVELPKMSFKKQYYLIFAKNNKQKLIELSDTDLSFNFSQVNSLEEIEEIVFEQIKVASKLIDESLNSSTSASWITNLKMRSHFLNNYDLQSYVVKNLDYNHVFKTNDLFIDKNIVNINDIYQSNKVKLCELNFNLVRKSKQIEKQEINHYIMGTLKIDIDVIKYEQIFHKKRCIFIGDNHKEMDIVKRNFFITDTLNFNGIICLLIDDNSQIDFTKIENYFK